MQVRASALTAALYERERSQWDHDHRSDASPRCRRSKVTVMNPDGQSASLAGNGGGFNYIAGPQANPVISSLSPTQGVSTGGDTVTISGSGFAPGATVTFGGVPATTIVVSSSVLTVVTPAVAPGSADVVVTNPGGGSVTLASLLHNQSFESGASYWQLSGSGGTETVGTITANAHTGKSYLELSSSGGRVIPSCLHPSERCTTLPPGISFADCHFRWLRLSSLRWIECPTAWR